MYFLAVWQEGHDREVWGARWREAERGKIGQVMYLHFFLQLCSPIFLSLIPNLQDHKLLFPAGHRCRRKEMRRKKQLRTLPKACRWSKETAKDLFWIKSKHKIVSFQCNSNLLGPDGWKCKGSFGRCKERKGAIWTCDRLVSRQSPTEVFCLKYLRLQGDRKREIIIATW